MSDEAVLMVDDCFDPHYHPTISDQHDPRILTLHLPFGVRPSFGTYTILPASSPPNVSFDGSSE